MPNSRFQPDPSAVQSGYYNDRAGTQDRAVSVGGDLHQIAAEESTQGSATAPHGVPDLSPAAIRKALANGGEAQAAPEDNGLVEIAGGYWVPKSHPMAKAQGSVAAPDPLDAVLAIPTFEDEPSTLEKADAPPPPEKPEEEEPEEEEEEEEEGAMEGDMEEPEEEEEVEKSFGLAEMSSWIESQASRPAIPGDAESILDDFLEKSEAMNQPEVEISAAGAYALHLAGIQHYTGFHKSTTTEPYFRLERSAHGAFRFFYKSGIFYGPRGGKWADAKRTIPWREGKNVTSGAAQEGSSVMIAHDGKEGRFDVKKREGDMVHLVHHASGKAVKIHKDELSKLTHKANKAALRTKQKGHQRVGQQELKGAAASANLKAQASSYERRKKAIMEAREAQKRGQKRKQNTKRTAEMLAIGKEIADKKKEIAAVKKKIAASKKLAQEAKADAGVKAVVAALDKKIADKEKKQAAEKKAAQEAKAAEDAKKPVDLGKKAPPTAMHKDGFSADDVKAGRGPYKVGDVLSTEHNSSSTAYVIDDYPYGSMRTQKRVWVETNKEGRQRLVSQTVNPKTGKLNKPKASIYSGAVVMEMDDKGHIATGGYSAGATAEAVEKFLADYDAHLSKRQKLEARFFVDQQKAVSKYLKEGAGYMQAYTAAAAEAMKSSGLMELKSAELKEKKAAAAKKAEEKKAQKKAQKESGPTGPKPTLPENVPSIAEVMNMKPGDQSYGQKFGGQAMFGYKQKYLKAAKDAAAAGHAKLSTQLRHTASAMSYKNEQAIARLKAHIEKHGNQMEKADANLKGFATKKQLANAIAAKFPKQNKQGKSGQQSLMLTGSAATALGKKNYETVQVHDLEPSDLAKLADVFGLKKGHDMNGINQLEDFLEKAIGEAQGMSGGLAMSGPPHVMPAKGPPNPFDGGKVEGAGAASGPSDAGPECVATTSKAPKIPEAKLQIEDGDMDLMEMAGGQACGGLSKKMSKGAGWIEPRQALEKSFQIREQVRELVQNRDTDETLGLGVYLPKQPEAEEIEAHEIRKGAVLHVDNEDQRIEKALSRHGNSGLQFVQDHGGVDLRSPMVKGQECGACGTLMKSYLTTCDRCGTPQEMGMLPGGVSYDEAVQKSLLRPDDEDEFLG